MPIAALGFRPHTYWTAVVALGGDPRAPEVLERRKVTFAEGDETFVYHAAESLSVGAAEAMLAAVRGSTTQKVTGAVGQLIADLEAHGIEVRAAAAPRGTLKVPSSIAEIVKVHAYMHAAEGHFYRDVVADGCERLGLRLKRPPVPGAGNGCRDVRQTPLEHRFQRLR